MASPQDTLGLGSGRLAKLIASGSGDDTLKLWDANTGKELWRTKRDEKSNWATPYLWENDLRTEIITSGTQKI